MPVARDRMDGNERFRSILNNGNPKVLGTLLTELGDAEAKRIIDECYRDENDTALIHCARKAGDGKNRKDKDLIDCCLLLMKHGADLMEFDDAGKTALHWACENRNESLVKTLLTSKADPWVKDSKGRNSLLLAVLSGAMDCVNIILEEGGDVKKNLNDSDKEGLSPIIAAVQKGNADIVSALITSGADVNAQEATTKRTPLHYALYIKRRDLFEHLLEHGASITRTDHRGTNIIHRCCAVSEAAFLEHVLVKHDKAQVKKALKMEDGEGATPVIVACQNGNVEQLRLLQQAEAPLVAKDKFKRCALHHCVENTNTECAELLLQWAPSLVQAADEEGLTPLHMAVIAGNVTLIKLLLAKGANLGAVDNEKHSVTHWATVCGHTSVLNVLLEAGAKLSTPDKYSAYPIHYASQIVAGRSDSEGGSSSSGSEGGSIQILKTLLKHKVSTEVEDKDHRTPIIWAASAGNSEGCRVLKEHGANVNRADKDDLTALHCAASRGHTDCVGSLIRHCKVGIDPVDKNHCTPLFYAATLGHLNTIRTLMEYEADCSHRDTRGRTVAHCATVSGSTEVLDILKDYNVDLWARNSKGDQPLHEAAQSGHIDIVQYLLDQASEESSKQNKNKNDKKNTNNKNTNNSKKNNDKNTKTASTTNNNKKNSNSSNSSNNSTTTATTAATTTTTTGNNINSSNNDGRTCLHIAALTNNVWLCNVLLEKGANVNTIMSNKGKYYTPYDAALIKGHTEAKDILRHHGGVPGTEVSNHAAATIQTKYKYHKKKNDVKNKGHDEEEEDDDEEEKEGGKEKEAEKEVSDDDEKNKSDDAKDQSKKSKKNDKIEKGTAAIVAGKSSGSDSDNSKKGGNSKSPEHAKPSYVEASTQVHTVSPGVLVGDTTEDEPSEKEPAPRSHTSKKASPLSDKSKSSPKTEKESEKNKKKSPSPGTSGSDSNNSKKGQGHKSSDSKVKSSPPLPLVIKTAVEDEETSDEDGELTSERSSHRDNSISSHGNSSDVESLGSVADDRNKKSSVSKSRHKNTTEATANGIAANGVKNNAKKNNNDTNKSTTKSQKQKQSQNNKESPSSHQPKTIVKETTSKSTKSSPNNDKSVNNNSNNNRQSSSDYSAPDSSRSKDTGGEEEGSSNRTTPRDSSSNTTTPRAFDSDRSSDRKSDSDEDNFGKSEKSSSATPDKDNNMGGLFSKRKVAAMNNNTQKEKEKESSPGKENGESAKRIQDGYTDYEDSDAEGGNKETESPRRKKTRPSKLISRIQESVRRYEEERRSIRRLHQVKRAQIYSAPMYDVSLFKAIMDNSQTGSQATPTSTASNWDEYLQEQIRIIQEDRKTARRGLSNRDQSCDNSTPTQSSHHPKSPNSSRRAPQSSRPSDRNPYEDPRLGRTAPLSRSNTQGVDSHMAKTKPGANKTTPSPGVSRQGRPERAQTAHVSRSQPSRGAARKDDPLQLKHEEQQRLLRQAYRPFGTMNGLSNHQRQMTTLTPRPATASNAKATSATSSKTGSTCGSVAGVRQYRAKTYTVMTSYGSRKYREPVDNSRTGDPSRRRNPLIFQDPDKYEKRHNATRTDTREDVVLEDDEETR